MTRHWPMVVLAVFIALATTKHSYAAIAIGTGWTWAVCWWMFEHNKWGREGREGRGGREGGSNGDEE